jgi:glycosyltransferase involved in cell wall biosynthesis
MEAGSHGCRVLWVTEEAPDRNLAGGSIRQAYLFEALARRFATDLLIAAPLADDGVRAAAADVTELETGDPLDPKGTVSRRAFELGVAFGSPYPLTVRYTRPARVALAKALAARAGDYDLICVEHAAFAPLIPASRRGRWIITFHHLLSGMIEQQVPLAPGRRQRWYRQRDVRKAQRMEAAALASYDRCVACSQEDAGALAQLSVDGTRSRIRVIPNGVDLARFSRTEVPPEPCVLFPAHLGWWPNIDGAVWLCTEVWPRVRAAVPDAQLMLVGRSPADEVMALGRLPGVSVESDVLSMTPYFDRARAVVVPLRIGTGTRLKALEAMAAGRPVVGTSVGLEGVGITDGVQARIADTPESFADAVVEVLRRDDLAGSLAASGRAHVESRFGWDGIGAQFVAMVTELLDDSDRSTARG